MVIVPGQSGGNVRKERTLTSTSLPEALSGLQPERVYAHFHALTQIPRCSGNEAGVREYIQAFAKERGLVCETDEIGNVLVRVNPDAAGEVVCLQGHMDMVCVAAEGVEHDFAKEPIQVRREGDMLYGTGTVRRYPAGKVAPEDHVRRMERWWP